MLSLLLAGGTGQAWEFLSGRVWSCYFTLCECQAEALLRHLARAPHGLPNLFLLASGLGAVEHSDISLHAACTMFAAQYS